MPGKSCIPGQNHRLHRPFQSTDDMMKDIFRLGVHIRRPGRCYDEYEISLKQP